MGKTREAAETLIAAGGRFLLCRPDKVPTVKGWSEGGPSDRDRKIVRYDGETRDYTAEEVGDWLDAGKGPVGLFQATADLAVVDFDGGDRGDWARWIAILGEPVCEVPSTSGRGIHAWYRRAAPRNWAAKGNYHFSLPGIVSDAEVAGDLKLHAGMTLLRDAAALGVLATARQAKSGCYLSDEAVHILTAPPGSPTSDAMRAARKLEEGRRHDGLLSIVGRTYQGAIKAFAPDGPLAEALYTLACRAGAEPKDMRRIATDVIRSRNAEREGQRPRGETGAARKQAPPDLAGLAGILAEEGFKVGSTRTGRRKMFLDLGGGWESATKARIDWLRGTVSDRYFYLLPKGETKQWWITREKLDAYLQTLAAENEIDLFADYLRGLPDRDFGEAERTRMDAIPYEVWDFGETDPEIVRFAFRSLLCGAIIRNRRPGAKFDHMVVLRGPQGIGKTSFVRALLPGAWEFRQLFGRANLRLLSESGGDKRLMEAIAGKVFCEVGELKGSGNLESVKDFLTQQEDEFRWAYDSETVQIPRTAIFVATSNLDTPIQSDPSGNRRYIPIEVGGVRGDLLADDRNPFRALWRVMDAGLRDEWWSLAKAAVEAEVRATAGKRDLHAEGVGNTLTTPPDWLVDRLAANVRGYERTSALADDLDLMMTGLSIADTAGGDPAEAEYILDLLPAETVYEVLGLSEAGKRPPAMEVGRVKSLMPRYGFHHRRRRYLLPGETRPVRRNAFARGPDLGGAFPEVDPEKVRGELTFSLARGEPRTNADIEAGAGPVRASLDDPDLPFP